MCKPEHVIFAYFVDLDGRKWEWSHFAFWNAGNFKHF